MKASIFFSQANIASSAIPKRGRILIISGPSGSGKSSIYKKASAVLDNLEFSVSCTTRVPRPGERDGVDYHFIDKSKFEELLAKNAFAEHAEVHGNYYGTLKTELTGRVARGIDVLLDIDVQGAAQIRELCGKDADFCGACTFIFIAPPSIEELERRLVGRGTETDEVIARRIHNAKSELARKGEYDHIIINDNLQMATNEFIDLVNKLRKQ